jgi:DNA polymerase-4
MRKIIHVDMDAFYASVEQRNDPSLRGRCVIVGGLPGTRGVVATASYEARKFGVHSAMPSNMAYKLCPRAVFLKPDFKSYEEVSKQIRSIFLDYSDLVEPLSLDEAYIDVTVNKKGGEDASRIALEIKRRIKKETGGLTASAGVSFNKFLAKVASDAQKPDGLPVITQAKAKDFIEALPIGRFFGVGAVTEKHMLSLGIKTGADLLNFSKLELVQHFGSAGEFYYQLARGVDDRPVCPSWTRKSLGTEETFQSDVDDLTIVASVLRRQAEEVSNELKRQRLKGRTITLKIKYFDFRNCTRSLSFQEPLDDAATIARVAISLLDRTDAGKVKIRLAGVTVSGFPEAEVQESGPVQLEFDFKGWRGR